VVLTISWMEDCWLDENQIFTW